jgi:hypothetical protein
MFVLLLTFLLSAENDEILFYITFLAINQTEKKSKRKEEFCCGVNFNAGLEEEDRKHPPLPSISVQVCWLGTNNSLYTDLY